MRRGVFLILAVLAPLACACALNPPRIVSIAPGGEATDVATDQPITITFDRAMNHESVERRFGLSPALPGCSGSNSCHFAWSGNTLTFIHAHVNFDVSTAYQVSMHAGYADATGQQNGLEHSWRFVTEGRPALVAVDPPDNATAVAPRPQYRPQLQPRHAGRCDAGRRPAQPRRPLLAALEAGGRRRPVRDHPDRGPPTQPELHRLRRPARRHSRQRHLWARPDPLSDGIAGPLPKDRVPRGAARPAGLRGRHRGSPRGWLPG